MDGRHGITALVLYGATATRRRRTVNKTARATAHPRMTAIPSLVLKSVLVHRRVQTSLMHASRIFGRRGLPAHNHRAIAWEEGSNSGIVRINWVTTRVVPLVKDQTSSNAIHNLAIVRSRYVLHWMDLRLSLVLRGRN